MVVREGTCFHLDPTQRTFGVNQDFGMMLANVVARFEAEGDSEVRSALGELRQVAEPAEFLLGLVLRMFLAHELYHIDQRLGSSQYEDSDGYGQAVTPVDYQADIGSIFYVHERYRADQLRLRPKSLLVLMLFAHLSVMRNFAPLGGRDAAEFQRLLTWHWQAARVAATSDVIDVAHSSLLQMPHLIIPALRVPPSGQEKVSLDDIGASNAPAASRQDLIVACCSPGGIMRITRFVSTSDGRVRGIVGRSSPRISQASAPIATRRSARTRSCWICSPPGEPSGSWTIYDAPLHWRMSCLRGSTPSRGEPPRIIC